MVHVIYLAIILILIGIIYFLFQKQQKIKSRAEEQIEKSQNETSATISETENRIKEESETKIKHIMTENSATIAGIEESYEKKLGRYEELIAYLRGTQRSEKTFAVYQNLTAIRKILVQSKRISARQMAFAGNIIVPVRAGGSDFSRADIILLLPTGLYLLDTRKYKGKVFHGISPEHAQGFERLIKENIPSLANGSEETLVMSGDRKQRDGNLDFLRITIDCYSDLAAPIMQAVPEFRAYLGNRQVNAERIVPVLYFMDDSADHAKAENFSEKEWPLICLNQNDLYQMISQELDREEWIFTAEKLLKIKRLFSEFKE
ncbi:hypothetical protein OYT88_13460 [Sporolactobacillus sp. CQH2019]|uniref:hypothetical protein n=1 Tax=Sporolactobacillus sp. CQH2019 TaxID=3023512 RepID=UPI0023675D69|nr:hypothetical protein [Sporolactobacillus sp. CQH2019]MDD9149554.1 hypothetical protein [Sporolactobacillus sp. CQH2019]